MWKAKSRSLLASAKPTPSKKKLEAVHYAKKYSKISACELSPSSSQLFGFFPKVYTFIPCVNEIFLRFFAQLLLSPDPFLHTTADNVELSTSIFWAWRNNWLDGCKSSGRKSRKSPGGWYSSRRKRCLCKRTMSKMSSRSVFFEVFYQLLTFRFLG